MLILLPFVVFCRSLDVVLNLCLFCMSLWQFLVLFVVILAVLLYAFVIVFRPFVVVSCLLLLILLPFLAFLKMF